MTGSVASDVTSSASTAIVSDEDSSLPVTESTASSSQTKDNSIKKDLLSQPNHLHVIDNDNDTGFYEREAGPSSSSRETSSTEEDDSSVEVVRKPLKGLLKKKFADDPKKKKRVKFSETMMVFCDDWPMEIMPQIIALKSPSDFNLVEVAASGYMFEPPIEYQDCLPFDPPPDYRDIIAQVTAIGSDDDASSDGSHFSYEVDRQAVDAHKVYWESVILNDKEVLEEDAIIGVLKEDAILQAIGAHVDRTSVFHPSFQASNQDDFDEQEGIPIHYLNSSDHHDSHDNDSVSPMSSLSSETFATSSPRSSTASAEADSLSTKKTVEDFSSSLSSPKKSEGKQEDEQLLSLSSPTESVQDLASDSSFTSQDTIIVMTKEIMKGNITFDDDEDDSLRDDVSLSSCFSKEGQQTLDKNTTQSSNQVSASTESREQECLSPSIGRFQIISCHNENPVVSSSETREEESGSKRNSTASSSSVCSTKDVITRDENHVTQQSKQRECLLDSSKNLVPSVSCQVESSCVSTNLSSSNQTSVELITNKRGSLSNSVSTDVSSETISSEATTTLPVKKKVPPPPPAKPASIQRLRVKTFEIGNDGRPLSFSSPSNEAMPQQSNSCSSNVISASCSTSTGIPSTSTSTTTGEMTVNETSNSVPKIPPLPVARSGSLPNSVVSVSQIRKAFERGNSLDSSPQSIPSSSLEPSPASSASTLTPVKEPPPHPPLKTFQTSSSTNCLVNQTKEESVDKKSKDTSLPNRSANEGKEEVQCPPPKPAKSRQAPLPPPKSSTLSMSASLQSMSTHLTNQEIHEEMVNRHNDSKEIPQVNKRNGEDLVEYTEEPSRHHITPAKRTSSLASNSGHFVTSSSNGIPEQGTPRQDPQPPVQQRLQSQPVYLSLNRRDPHQLLTIFNNQSGSPNQVLTQQQLQILRHQQQNQLLRLQAAQQQQLQSSPNQQQQLSPQNRVEPPPRTASVQVSPGIPGVCPQKQALCAQIIKTQQMMHSPGQVSQSQGSPAQQSSSGQPSPQAIYGYIQAMSGGCPINGLATLPRNAAGIHYHPGMLLQPMNQKLSNSQEFPNPSEIRRRDGLNAFPHIYNEPPQPGKIPVPPVCLQSSRDNCDELEQFVQQEQNRTSRIRQRYGVNDDDEDPSFGFTHRPAVRGIRTETPPTGSTASNDPTVSTTDQNVLLLQQQQHQQQQIYLQRLQLLQLQQQMLQQHQNKNQVSHGQQAVVMQSGQQQPSPKSQVLPQGQNPQGTSQQHPLPPNRHVYLVHGVPQSQHLVSAAGATLPRNTQLRTLSTLTPQQTQQLQQHLQRQQQLQQQQQLMQQQVNVARQQNNHSQQGERPASSLGQSSEGTPSAQPTNQCTQCLLQRQQAVHVLHQHQLQQHQLRHQHPPPAGQHLHTAGRPGSVHNPNLAQLANNNNSLLTYKTISMPNVAMIRPIGPLSVVTGNIGVPGISQNSDMNASPRHPTANETNSQTSQPRISMSASSALSTMARNEQMQHPTHMTSIGHVNNHVNNNNPDLVKDVTLRSKGLSSDSASSSTSSCQHHHHQASSSNRSSLSMHSQSSPSPSSSKGSSTSSSHPTSSLSAIASATGISFLKSKNKTSDSKEDKKQNKKDSKKSDRKDKKEKTTTKEGVIYYSMNV